MSTITVRFHRLLVGIFEKLYIFNSSLKNKNKMKTLRIYLQGIWHCVIGDLKCRVKIPKFTLSNPHKETLYILIMTHDLYSNSPQCQSKAPLAYHVRHRLKDRVYSLIAFTPITVTGPNPKPSSTFLLRLRLYYQSFISFCYAYLCFHMFSVYV